MAADLTLVRSLAEATHLAVLATTRSDGTVHASLVSAGVLDHPIGGRPAVGVVVAGDARKLTHIRRSGRAAATFSHGYAWVSVEGPAVIVGLDDADSPIPLPDLLRRVFVAAGGVHDDWAAYDRAMLEERRAAVFIDPVRILGNA
jgi:PPOX class probable F420-dependent enzyme